MKRAFIAIALLLAGLIIGAYVTANTIMVNAEITGTAGNYVVTIFGESFIYQ